MDYTLNKISGSAAHSAFTDLCFWKGNLYCCFREALNHISGDGKIKIVKLDMEGKPTGQSTILEEQSDLRDPKLTVTPDDQLMLLAYQRKIQSGGSLQYCRPVVFLSPDGKSWSSKKLTGQNRWWLWRLRWHSVQHKTAKTAETKAYGFAYNRGANSIHLYAGDPRRTLQCHSYNVLSLKEHNLGYPNESDLMFEEKNAWAIIRRDADTCTAQLGTSVYPFKKWRWHDLGIYLGGPCMIKRDQKNVWLAGRIWRNAEFVTALFSLNLESKALRLICELPSAGDNSYPGLVQYQNQLYMSYYSSHEDNRSQIYLATFYL